MISVDSPQSRDIVTDSLCVSLYKVQNNLPSELGLRIFLKESKLYKSPISIKRKFKKQTVAINDRYTPMAIQSLSIPKLGTSIMLYNYNLYTSMSKDCNLDGQFAKWVC